MAVHWRVGEWPSEIGLNTPGMPPQPPRGSGRSRSPWPRLRATRLDAATRPTPGVTPRHPSTPTDPKAEGSGPGFDTWEGPVVPASGPPKHDSCPDTWLQPCARVGPRRAQPCVAEESSCVQPQHARPSPRRCPCPKHPPATVGSPTKRVG